jgi:hypothetical protein
LRSCFSRFGRFDPAASNRVGCEHWGERCERWCERREHAHIDDAAGPQFWTGLMGMIGGG